MPNPEVRKTTRRRIRVATALSLGLALTACASDNDRVSKYSSSPYATAEQFATSAGGNVSEFPNPEQGSKGNIRYCDEIGASPKARGADGAKFDVICTTGDTELTLTYGVDSTRKYDALCRSVEGHVVIVRIGLDTDATIPACHVPSTKPPR